MYYVLMKCLPVYIRISLVCRNSVTQLCQVSVNVLHSNKIEQIIKFSKSCYNCVSREYFARFRLKLRCYVILLYKESTFTLSKLAVCISLALMFKLLLKFLGVLKEKNLYHIIKIIDKYNFQNKTVTSSVIYYIPYSKTNNY